MSEKYKNITAIGLIIGGLFLFGYNYLHSSQPPAVNGQKVNQKINLDSLTSIKSSEPTNERQADILALFILKSDVCPPCVNNTLEYIDLIKQENKNIAATALFIEDEPDKVHRFVNITNLHVPYRIGSKQRVVVQLSDMMQEMIFINTDDQEIFYRVPIPGNVTTELEYKQEVLKQVYERWDELKNKNFGRTTGF